MMSKIIDGKKISLEIKNELKEKVSLLKVKPKLVVISVGDNEASKVYVGQKEKCKRKIRSQCSYLIYCSDKEEVWSRYGCCL